MAILKPLRIGLFGLLVVSALGAKTASLEYQVKAAFLLNFAKFVEWPPDSFTSDDAPIAICVLGEDPFGGELERVVEGEKVDAHKLVVRKVHRPLPAKTCQVVFVPKSEKDFAPAEFERGVLTVGESDDFLRRGGMIAFVIDDRKVRFDISTGAADKAGVKLSSKLLRVARTVEK